MTSLSTSELAHAVVTTQSHAPQTIVASALLRAQRIWEEITVLPSC